MSRTTVSTHSASSANFQSIFDAALIKYKRKTKNDLLANQLIVQLEDCDSPGAILDLFNRQYNIRQFIQSRNDGGSSKQWLNTTVTILCALSGILGQGVGIVFSPAKVIFAGIGVLLMAAKDVGASQGALVDLFDRIETFFQRLEIYIKVRVTEAMKNLIAKIMAEILGILAIATKEIRQGWGKRYLKKLTGKTDIEDALTRLEKLSNDEALTATVQVLEAADSMDGKMEQVVDVTQQIESDVGDLKRDHLQANLQTWLSPPDPSINYNTARDAYHNGTATWFTRGHTYQDWKTSGSGSLFWVHGKAGSGKTILSSAIVDDFKQSLDTRPSHMVYFFFDFKDTAKQDIRALHTSLLVQLCRQSNLCFEALFDLYSTHDNGEQQPSESALSHCLKSMFRVLGQVPIYLIIDALDECPNTSKSIGAPRSRQKVLEFLKEIVELHLPNLHICVTSRPEFDIQNTFQQLTHLKISLHDEDGQKQDIAEYVHSVIYSDNELVMKKWRQEIKDLVIKALSEKADGMFRWVVCQLETLRECLARNVERVLSELPESLDETYLRVLKGVKSANRGDVYRLLQCLVVAVRPLRVDELGEVLAVNFDSGDGIPQLNPDWRWEDQEEALQAACSSLIAIVDTGESRVVQFSHFSVKEFLTSPRLADSSADVSRYHISLEPAHTILAQSCLGVFLRLPVHEDLHEDNTKSEYSNEVQECVVACFGRDGTSL
ncbi:NACHT domain-containing protein [Lactifluus volemus]|nr:NACHT domain-containing protein [Lactifluus volemus]